MRKRIRDERGNMTVLSAFLLLFLVTISLVIYTVGVVYTKVDVVQTELERAGSIAVDREMVNRNIRDLQLDIPPEPTLADLESNLVAAGWTQNGEGTWEKDVGGVQYCKITGLDAEVSEGWMNISGTLSIPLPWSFGTSTALFIPIAVQTKVLYFQ